MSLLAALRDALPGQDEALQSCVPCAHFCDDPARLEAALPGLAALSSGHASVRGRDGLCLLHQRLINGRRRCEAFAPPASGMPPDLRTDSTDNSTSTTLGAVLA